MKSLTIKNYYQIGLSLTALSATLGLCQSALAASFELGGYQWDSANSVTTGKIIQGQEQIFTRNVYFQPGDKDPSVANLTIGNLLGNTTPSTTSALALGKDDKTESIIELSWVNGMSLANENGNDLVIYESSNSNDPRAFAVAVHKVGTNDFTNYLYQFSTGYFDGYTYPTVFDFSSFGLNLGDQVDSIRIKNLIPSDKVTGQDGQGFLGGQYQPEVGPNGNGKTSYTSLHPYITFVAGLHQTKPIPEPTTTLSLLALGAFGLSSLGKRKQH